MSEIVIHIGGSCETQTGSGGWAAVLKCGERQRILQGSNRDTTLNAMELNAVIEALQALKQPGCRVQLFTHSRYLVQGVQAWLEDWIRRGWKNTRGRQIANLTLWQQLKTLLDQHQVILTWLPREQNDQADELARHARLKPKPADDTGSPMASIEPPQAVSALHLMVAGSRYATREALDYARRVVRRAHQLGYIIVVGDNPKGIDMAVVQECRRLKAKVVVVGVTNRPRNGGCLHGSYLKVERDTYRAAGGGLLDRFTVRDRAMVDMCQRGMFIWNGESPGTKAGYDYMVSRHKAAHLVTFEPKVARRHV